MMHFFDGGLVMIIVLGCMLVQAIPMPSEPPDASVWSNTHGLAAYASITAATLAAIWLGKKPGEAVPDVESMVVHREWREREKQGLYDRFVIDGLPPDLARCIADRMYPDDGRHVMNAPWTWISHLKECNRMMKARQEQERQEQQAQASPQQSTEVRTTAAAAADENTRAQEQQRTKSDTHRSDARWLDGASSLVRGTLAGGYRPPHVKVDVGSLAKGLATYASSVRPMSPRIPLRMSPV